MHDVETRRLRRAALLLLLVSGVRLALTHATDDPTVPVSSVLPELTREAAAAKDDADRRSRPLGEGEKIDPNRAAEADLDRLPGIGPALARAIIAARDSGIAFARPEDLLVVRGIGPKLLVRIGAHIELKPPVGTLVPRPGGRPAAVDINRAGLEELQTLPGVGPAIAERILRRRRRGLFGTLDDLLEVNGIGPATLERLRSRATVSGSG